MVILSNGQNESSLSVKRSASECDAVSNRLTVEKLATQLRLRRYLKLQRGPMFKFRRLHRNQTPKFSSAPKLKSTAAVSIAEDDVDAEEKPEPKEKRILKIKKPVVKTAMALNYITPNSPVLLRPVAEDDQGDMIEYGAFQNEMEDVKQMLAHFTTNIKAIVENRYTQMRALVNRKLGLNVVYSILVPISFDDARVRMLQWKRQEVEILRLKADAKYFALLKEECSMQLEILQARSDVSSKPEEECSMYLGDFQASNANLKF